MFGKRISSLLLSVFVFSTFTWADTIYVKSGSGGDGSSWAAAYGNLHTALDDAEPNDSIWVAAGTFSTGGTPYQMKNGVGIYGGFPNTGDPDLSDRNPGTYLSILRGNNSRVFSNTDLDPNAVLDGFTITGGRADDGGGMYNANSDPTIINCTFSSNRTYSGSDGQDGYCTYGVGGQTCGSSAPATSGDSGGNGGGMYNENSSPTLINCIFKGNGTGSGGNGGDALGYGIPGGPGYGGSGGNGGGMYNHFSSPILINCMFLDNLTGTGGAGGRGVPCGDCGNGGNGAGMYNNYSLPTLINCTFNGNNTGRGGYADLTCFYTGTPDGSPGVGGGMYNANSSPVVTNCIFWGNFGGEISVGATVIYSDVQGGYPGIGNIDSIPFSVCSTVRLSPGSPCIDAGDNNAVPGYILTDLEGNPRFIDIPDINDTGNGTPPIVDMGAYEYNPLAEPEPYAGSGTAADPYQIWSGAEFSAIRCHPEDWDKHFRLMGDIDISNYTGHPIYNIIGYEVPGGYKRPFTGVFDGAGHTISGFEYYDSGGPIGLFGYVEGALIMNLILIDPSVVSPSQRDAGALVGKLSGGEISNCHVVGGIVEGDDQTGGLVGWINDGIVTKCFSTASVLGEDYVGGLAGSNGGAIIECHSGSSVSGEWDVGGLVGSSYGGVIAKCYSTGDVTGYRNVGGLMGFNDSESVSDCYAVGSVSGSTNVGGLCGINNRGTITACYSTGIVDANENAGGLVGVQEIHLGAVTEDSYWDTDTSGQSSSAGGTGLPTAQMKTRSTFTNAGWDFVAETINGPNDIWRLCEDLASYPRLAWEFPSVDFVCPDGVDFFDYSFFSSYWQQDNCAASNNCDGTDLDLLGSVGINDLRIFADNWLAYCTPGPVSNPNPIDGAVIVNLDADLSWAAGLYATSHDVYFGTDNPPPFIQNQFTTTFDPGTMASNTNYYWRIDSVNVWGKTSGLVWRFSTMLPPPP